MRFYQAVSSQCCCSSQHLYQRFYHQDNDTYNDANELICGSATFYRPSMMLMLTTSIFSTRVANIFFAIVVTTRSVVAIGAICNSLLSFGEIVIMQFVCTWHVWNYRKNNNKSFIEFQRPLSHSLLSVGLAICWPNFIVSTFKVFIS